jgi:tetratricopeptide (TPR) repeat protein
MVRTDPGIQPSENNERALILQGGGRNYRVSLEKALALAHNLIKAKRYQAALQICQKVIGLNAQNVQAAVLLACCEAGLKDYEACQKTLQAVFSGDKTSLAEHLQAAFVYHNLGMESDSVQELIALTDEVPDSAMVWLLLGDRLNEMGKRKKATECWRYAIDRDKQHGAATMAARHELACAAHVQDASAQTRGAGQNTK